MTVRGTLSALSDASWWAVHVWLGPAQVVARAAALCAGSDDAAGRGSPGLAHAKATAASVGGATDTRVPVGTGGTGRVVGETGGRPVC